MAQSIIELSEQRGLEQGIAQGTRETTVKNILTVLTRRFPESNIRTPTQALAAIRSLERLEQLLDTALLAPTFNDFLQALDP